MEARFPMIIKLVEAQIAVEGRVNLFHTTMFHGEGRRPPKRADWESCDHDIEDDLSDPILYTCNGYRTPDLATPSLHFIASAQAHAALADLPGLRFAPVVLEKVIYLPYVVGDFSYFDRTEFRRNPRRFAPDKVFQRWADCAELHASLGARYEVVFGNARRMASRYPDAREVGLPDPRGEDDELEAVPLSERMMNEHSLVRTMRGTAFTPEAFQRVERFLDRDYYAVVDVRI
jgi:hypothetical protein